MTSSLSPPWRIVDIAVGTEGEAIALLQQCGLETSDIRPEASGFLGAKLGDSLSGLIGLERLGHYGLVRSMAVAPAVRGRGIARALYAELERRARNLGLTDLYALTESAEAFFRQAGFKRIGRADAPPAMAATAQFAALCPASAAVMHLNLGYRSSPS